VSLGLLGLSSILYWYLFGVLEVVKWSVSFVGCCVIIPAFSYLSLHSV
jgi:hypothetical protein